ncbi:MAG TPA: helix-turn-helix domain-containing protein [Verrucomicrobiales bacterium]|jgi:excisionase family DNA binding protein|nr:helix-turn-helix domain-containing protein [Verrucomicrobiales bacterium]
MNNPTNTDQTPLAGLLTKAQAAEYLGIKVRTLDDWRAAKAIPHISRGGYVRFRRGDLDEFLTAHTIAARPTTPYRPRRRKAQLALTQ